MHLILLSGSRAFWFLYSIMGISSILSAHDWSYAGPEVRLLKHMAAKSRPRFVFSHSYKKLFIFWTPKPHLRRFLGRNLKVCQSLGRYLPCLLFSLPKCSVKTTACYPLRKWVKIVGNMNVWISGTLNEKDVNSFLHSLLKYITLFSCYHLLHLLGRKTVPWGKITCDPLNSASNNSSKPGSGQGFITVTKSKFSYKLDQTQLLWAAISLSTVLHCHLQLPDCIWISPHGHWQQHPPCKH